MDRVKGELWTEERENYGQRKGRIVDSVKVRFVHYTEVKLVY